CGLPRPLAACRHQTSPNWFGSRGSLYLATVHGVVKDLAELGYVLVLQVLALVLGDLLDLALVALRDDHALDPLALRRARLLLDAADGTHLAGQRDLARHRDVVGH